jgi:glycosyltransferase involved in cell wall biosynthesis
MMSCHPSSPRGRVLFIGPLPPPVTGHSLACQVLHDALGPTHDVTLVNLRKESLESGITSVGRLGEIFSVFRKVWRGRRDASVIYLTISESVAGNLKDLVIYALCWRKLDRLVVHLHGGSIRANVFNRLSVLRTLNRACLKRIGAAVVLGDSHRSIFDGLVPRHRLHVIANFAQDDFFTDEHRLREKFADTGIIHVMFLSNLIAGKGHDDLLRGYQLLPAALRSRVKLHFAGAFESTGTETAFLARVGDDSGVILHGVVSGAAKLALLRSAQIFALPSTLLEGQPISILEAYASGCAVISTASGGIADIFRDHENGCLVGARSPEMIRDSIVTLLRDPARLSATARRNWMYAGQSFRSVRYTTELISLFHLVETGA